jgi:hypothetical protein
VRAPESYDSGGIQGDSRKNDGTRTDVVRVLWLAVDQERKTRTERGRGAKAIAAHLQWHDRLLVRHADTLLGKLRREHANLLRPEDCSVAAYVFPAIVGDSVGFISSSGSNPPREMVALISRSPTRDEPRLPDVIRRRLADGPMHITSALSWV